MRSSFTCVTQLGLGKDYKNLGVGSGKLDGLKEANRLKMRRKISCEECGEFYVQVFTSFLEERSQIGRNRPASSSFFRIVLRSSLRRRLDTSSASFSMLGQVALFSKHFVLFARYLSTKILSLFSFSTFESSRNFYTVEDEHKTRLRQHPLSNIRQNVTTTSRVLDLTP